MSLMLMSAVCPVFLLRTNKSFYSYFTSSVEAISINGMYVFAQAFVATTVSAKSRLF